MDDAVSRLNRAAAAVDPAIRGIRADQLGLPTPCEGWDVRTLLDHLIGNLHRWAATFGGGAQGTAPTLSDAGDDVAAAWEGGRDALLGALAAPGALDGELAPNLRMLVGIMPVEVLLHGWDAARATGQSTDFDPELADETLEMARPLLAKFERAPAFGEEQPAPPGCTAADRLAAFYGRRV